MKPFFAASCFALATTTLFVSAATVVQADMVLQSYDAKNHFRFYNGVDKDFIGEAYDSSGVGRGSNRWATMISDTYFLSATHFHLADGLGIRFFHSNDSAGASELHTVASGVQIAGSDLWLGRLSTAPSASVKRYPILSFADTADYDNLEIYTYGQDAGVTTTAHRLGRNNFDPGSITTVSEGGSTGEVFTYDFDNPTGGVGADESYLQGGDSGGPSFAVHEGEFALLGIHWFNYTVDMSPEVGSGDTLVPSYISALNAAMLDGESVTAVPEVSPVFILLTGLAVAVFASLSSRKAKNA